MSVRENAKLNKVMLRRIMIVLIALVVLTSGVTGVRLAKIMIVDGEEYQAKASEQLLYDTTLAAPRGDIYDANMNILATSATCWTVYLSPNNLKKVKDAAELSAIKSIIAEKLSSILLIISSRSSSADIALQSHISASKKPIDACIGAFIRILSRR